MAGYFGDPGIDKEDPVQSLMPILHAVRNRDLQDFTERGRITNDLAIRQERQRALFDPRNPGTPGTTNNLVSTGINNANTNMNTVLKEDMSPQEKANLQLKKNDQSLEARKIAQTGKLGEERLGINKAQEQLNESKNTNIHEQKQADLQRKVDEADKKLKLSYDQLQQKTDSAEAHAQFNRDQMEATSARHELERAQKDREIQDLKDLHAAQIGHLNQQVEDLRNPKSTEKTTEIENDKNGVPIKKTEKTTKGDSKAFDSNTTYNMQDQSGKKWTVKHENLEAAKKSGLTMVTK